MEDSNLGETLKPYLSAMRVPKPGDKVFKDECLLSFDTPESETGLYVCLNTFLGYGRDYVDHHVKKTGNKIFLHLRKIKKLLPQEKSELEPEKKITRLAIGIEGGFPMESTTKFEYEEKHSVAIYPGPIEIPLPHPNLPLELENSIQGILAAPSARHLEELSALESTWDGENRQVSKFAANLEQLHNGVRVPPQGWQCSKCDKTENLWMNLSDGTVLCGRKFFDGTGGNNHALEHYEATGYPLAVKLGTISGDGKADVYSYAEDDMVEDPYLKHHLAHFGINMDGMKKTDKSMAELEIDLNQRVGEWASIQETGKSLVPLFGPGYTGLTNLGNSCYLNSVIQVLFTVPSFQERFFNDQDAIISAADTNAFQDFNVQMSKLAVGILSGRYSLPIDDVENQHQQGIKPSMFKSLVGKGHPEFSTKRQQDAVEFLLHMINITERNMRVHPKPSTSPVESFKFQVEERLQCLASGQVRYTRRPEYHLPVPVPLDTASNTEEVRLFNEQKKAAMAAGQPFKSDDVVRPKVTLQSCFEALIRPEEVQNFYSSAINAKTTALKTTKLATFPDYLWIQLRKFTLAEDWTPVKLDVAVEIPLVIDLSFMKADGKQTNEVLMSDETIDQLASNSAVEPAADLAVVESLTEMGFPLVACKRAAILTHGAGLEAATQWIMEHMDDPDFLTPLLNSSSGIFKADEEGVAMLQSMGFSRSQCVKALQNTDNNVERAADWIFSHPDEISSGDCAPAPSATPTNASALSEPTFIDGPPVYELAAFISHMGTSTSVGHYVCHIKRDGRWVIYNDEKVAVSENPPFELGYLYLYRRSP
ncbi:ubiquitin carboxyl-terminal hydrolase 5-like [Daphnia carinata]|uniref:ubiquitin carboxyl-terminal hydrolase 5-like n=1 Tax=Daphnia carinata TaxID=120202 RepID=UPI00257EBF7E|nr:ubiquitin carboxyl-terminal hydrolase 5-like [Daphnia carinata]